MKILNALCLMALLFGAVQSHAVTLQDASVIGKWTFTAQWEGTHPQQMIGELLEGGKTTPYKSCTWTFHNNHLVMPCVSYTYQGELSADGTTLKGTMIDSRGWQGVWSAIRTQ